MSGSSSRARPGPRVRPSVGPRINALASGSPARTRSSKGTWSFSRFIRTGKSSRRAPRLRPIAFMAFAMMVVLGAVVTAFLIVDLSAEGVFRERERSDSLTEMAWLKDVYRREGAAELPRHVERRLLQGWTGQIYGYFDPSGRPLAGNLQALPQGLSPGAWRHVAARSAVGAVELDAATWRVPGGSVLVVGHDLAGERKFERTLLGGSAVALALVAAASLAVGFLLNHVVNRRAESVAGVAERIAAGDLAARAQVSPRGDSFDRIGRSLNAMLNRVEELVTQMRVVTDSLSHDLRTPLTRMRASLEKALNPSSNEEERRRAVEFAHDQIEQILSIFSALSDIARAEAGVSKDMMQPVRLDTLIGEMAELFGPEIEDAGQLLEAPALPPVVVSAHAPLLRHAVGNLLFNAARHAGEGARVTMGLREEEEFAEIVVADSGRGVPEGQLGRIAQRFVTLDGARSGGGSGLGLAIASAAAKLHGGELVLQDNEPGLRATLRLSLRLKPA
jgi:signal transduction histidine kinase